MEKKATVKELKRSLSEVLEVREEHLGAYVARLGIMGAGGVAVLFGVCGLEQVCTLTDLIKCAGLQLGGVALMYGVWHSPLMLHIRAEWDKARRKALDDKLRDNAKGRG